MSSALRNNEPELPGWESQRTLGTVFNRARVTG